MRRPIAALLLLAALLVAPMESPARVVVWGGFGYPPYPLAVYPAFYYPYPYPYPLAYPYAPTTPPPGWVAGHWERRQDSAGNPVDVWVPQHLR